MARNKDKIEVLKMRKSGMSYSQIKEKTGIAKSTLSNWLSDYPLSKERMRELRDNSQIRIEKYRETMRKKREERRAKVYNRVSKDIGSLNKRELFIAGLFLYWGEGMKTEYTTTGFTNTDPGMIRFFLEWLYLLGVEKNNIRVILHLYKDMDKEIETSFWSKQLSLPKKCFGKAYVKKSKQSDIKYRNSFGHGTCNIKVYDRDLAEYVLYGVKYLRTIK